MWLAADEAAGGNPELIIAVFAFAGVVATAIGAIIVALINSRSKSTTPSPPAPVVVPAETHSLERLAVIERRLDDSDERDEIQDRRLNRVEQHLDMDNPFWMGRPR